MNKQEIFDKVYAHAQTMTAAAAENGKCRYRSANGPCLIGHLIPDELYTPDLDDLPTMASSPRIIELLVKAGYPEDVVRSDLLFDIQRVHDGLYIDDRHDLNRNGGPDRSIERANTFNSRLLAGLAVLASGHGLVVNPPH